MKQLIFFAIAFFATFHVFAQNDSNPKIRISDLGIYSGMTSGFSSTGDPSDFLKLAPESTLLQNDLSTFTKSNMYIGPTTVNSAFTINLGLQFYNKQKQTYNSNPQLNLGITFIGANSLSAYYSKSENVRFDTLSSNNSASVVFMDSLFSQSYQMNYLYQQIGLNANIIFRTQPQARWSLFSGLGVTTTVSLAANTHISYNNSEYINYIFSNAADYRAFNNSQTNSVTLNEIHEGKTNISVFAYIPLGVDFRISKKSEFWNKMHLTFDMQPGLVLDYIPELSTKIYGTMRGNFGLRVEI